MMNTTNHPLTSRIFFICSSFLLMVVLTSCSPAIQYLGDSYQPSNEIDVFYDAKDVQKEYRTIGRMTHGNMFDYEVETIKNKMIEMAKRKGGDAIIFLEMKNEVEQDPLGNILDDDRIAITAQVIKYQ